jgi:hypothetical protein
MPTGQPTSGPTYQTDPEIVRIAGSEQSTYWCHPNHPGASPSAWQQIWGGITLSDTTDYVREVHVWSSTWSNDSDSLGMKEMNVHPHSNTLTNNYVFHNITQGSMFIRLSQQIGMNYSSQISPKMVYSPLLVNEANEEAKWWLPNTYWTEIIRMVSYRLYDTNINCDMYIGQTRTFNLEIKDRRNRTSTIYQHNMHIKSAGIIYTNREEIITTNSAYGRYQIMGNLTSISQGKITTLEPTPAPTFAPTT